MPKKIKIYLIICITIPFYLLNLSLPSLTSAATCNMVDMIIYGYSYGTGGVIQDYSVSDSVCGTVGAGDNVCNALNSGGGGCAAIDIGPGLSYEITIGIQNEGVAQDRYRISWVTPAGWGVVMEEVLNDGSIVEYSSPVNVPTATSGNPSFYNPGEVSFFVFKITAPTDFTGSKELIFDVMSVEDNTRVDSVKVVINSRDILPPSPVVLGVANITETSVTVEWIAPSEDVVLSFFDDFSDGTLSPWSQLKNGVVKVNNMQIFDEQDPNTFTGGWGWDGFQASRTTVDRYTGTYSYAVTIPSGINDSSEGWTGPLPDTTGAKRLVFAYRKTNPNSYMLLYFYVNGYWHQVAEADMTLEYQGWTIPMVSDTLWHEVVIDLSTETQGYNGDPDVAPTGQLSNFEIAIYKEIPGDTIYFDSIRFEVDIVDDGGNYVLRKTDDADPNTVNTDPNGGRASLQQKQTIDDFELILYTRLVSLIQSPTNRYSITDSSGNGYGLFLNFALEELYVERRKDWGSTFLGTASAGSGVLTVGQWYTLRFTKVGQSLTARAYIGRVDPSTANPVATVTATDSTPLSSFSQVNVNGGYVYDTDDVQVNSLSGSVASYDLRYSTLPITTDSEFTNATKVGTCKSSESDLGKPKTAGSLESCTVSGLFTDTDYYFALKTTDETGNTSLISTCPTCPAHTAILVDDRKPSDIIDLNLRDATKDSNTLCWTAPLDSNVAFFDDFSDGTLSPWSQLKNGVVKVNNMQIFDEQDPNTFTGGWGWDGFQASRTTVDRYTGTYSYAVTIPSGINDSSEGWTGPLPDTTGAKRLVFAYRKTNPNSYMLLYFYVNGYWHQVAEADMTLEYQGWTIPMVSDTLWHEVVIDLSTETQGYNGDPDVAPTGQLSNFEIAIYKEIPGDTIYFDSIRFEVDIVDDGGNYVLRKTDDADPNTVNTDPNGGRASLQQKQTIDDFELILYTRLVSLIQSPTNRYSITDSSGNGYGLFLNFALEELYVERRKDWGSTFLGTASAGSGVLTVGQWYTLRFTKVGQSLTARAYIGRVDPSTANPVATVTATDSIPLSSFSQVNVNGGYVYDTDDVRVNALDKPVTAYLIRYSTKYIVDDGITPGMGEITFTNATPVQVTGLPKSPGSQECYTIQVQNILAGNDGIPGTADDIDRTPNTQFFFAIKAEDENYNLSSLSNVAQGLTAMSSYLYNMVSVPKAPNPNAPASVFGDDVSPSSLYLYQWNSRGVGSDQGCYDGLPGQYNPYNVIPACTGISDIKEGNGYFLWSPRTDIVLDVPPGSTDVSTDVCTDELGQGFTCYTLLLKTGWNMFGNPSWKEVDVARINIQDPSGSVKSFQNAVASGWIEGAIYAYNGINYTDEACNSVSCNAVIQPWKGYWVSEMWQPMDTIMPMILYPFWNQMTLYRPISHMVQH